MIDFFKRYAPPGLDLKPELRVFITGNIVSAVLSMFSFFRKYPDARDELFKYHSDGTKELIQGAVIAPFSTFITGVPLYFSLAAIFMLAFIIYHYLYYRQGSMSIYLMKRLPRRFELHKRAISLPLMMSLATVAVSLAMIFIYFVIYFIATPKICLPYEAFRKIWR